MADIPLIAQTTYAELLERCETAAFGAAFAAQGNFVVKSKKGRQGIRRYWYFQEQTDEGRRQKYVGPETPELLERIARHRNTRSDEDARRKLVSALIRTFGMPRPTDEIGRVVASLADAGVFRLRAVLVGTCAYQTYATMLGVRLSSAALMTEDVDIAQFKNVSIAVDDAVPHPLDTLRLVDSTFVPVPHTSDQRRCTSYRSARGTRVDFLTPNEGPETDEPQLLPAQSTDAQPLRYLDFLIHDCVSAAVLHGAGVLVQVPVPERYAIHKLIVTRCRRTIEKRNKDLMQAEALILALARLRQHELRDVWKEAVGRGKKWKRLLFESLSDMSQVPRDTLLKVVGLRRQEVPGLFLSFDRTQARYDFDRDTVIFPGTDTAGAFKCGITREALDDYFDAGELDPAGRLQRFQAHRAEIERLARAKYTNWPIDNPGEVLIRAEDVEPLRAC